MQRFSDEARCAHLRSAPGSSERPRARRWPILRHGLARSASRPRVVYLVVEEIVKLAPKAQGAVADKDGGIELFGHTAACSKAFCIARQFTAPSPCTLPDKDGFR